MAEWLGNGLQNRVQQFDSAWYLLNPSQMHSEGDFCLKVKFLPTHLPTHKSKGPIQSPNKSLVSALIRRPNAPILAIH